MVPDPICGVGEANGLDAGADADGAGAAKAAGGAKGDSMADGAGAAGSAMRVMLGPLGPCRVGALRGPPVHMRVLATRGPDREGAAGLATGGAGAGASPSWVKLPPQAGQNCSPAWDWAAERAARQ